MRYAIIIPVKNEEGNISNLLTDIINQQLKPILCLVINDHSTDRTAQIVESFSSQAPFIHMLNSEIESSYELGAHIIRLFEQGVHYIFNQGMEVDYIVKMDADIHFDEKLFLSLSQKLGNRTDVGIVSPQPYQIIQGKKVLIKSPDWHTNGDFKIYSTRFLKEIEHLPRGLGWDCSDNIHARLLGYKTFVIEEIQYQQKRPIGRFSLLKGRYRQGLGAYSLDYSLLYLLLKGLHDFFKPPFIIGSIYYWWGYLSAALKRQGHIHSKQHARLMRKLFWQSFFKRLSNKEFFIFKPKN